MKQYSKIIGILLGLIVGLPQAFEIPNNPMFPTYNAETHKIIIAFGLFAPPILAFLNKFIGSGFGMGIYLKLNEYINLFALMISSAFSMGFGGLAVYYFSGGQEASLITLSFFASAGVGFFIAYFIDPNLGYRSEKNA